MIEDFRMKVFEAVARLGSFTAAARELRVSQPAISQNITELEKQVGRKLFNRSRAEVAMTEDGRRFLAYAHQIIHWYDAANEAFAPDSKMAPKSLDLGDGRQALVWSCEGDIHIPFPTE